MGTKLGVKARAHARRAGEPGNEASYLHLSAGPHLFLDWRFVLPGEGPFWADEDGQKIPLLAGDLDEWKDRPIDARYVSREVPRGIRIVAQVAEKGAPFEGNGPPGPHIIHEEGVYRTWYKVPGAEGAEPEGATHYAESSDGYEWGKETACEFDWSACPEAAGRERSPFIDPSAPEDERFKMFFRVGGAISHFGRTDEHKNRIVEEFQRTRPDDIYPIYGTDLEHLGGMYGAVSPDGIHWKGIPGPLVIHSSDTTNVVYYDEKLERYVWYARCNWYYGRRCIGRAETDDFRRWPGPEMLVWPTPDLHPTDDWYTNSKTRYPGEGDHHLMFPVLYHRSNDTTEIRLFSSPDGMVWCEVPGGPVISPGAPGTFDGGCVFGGLDMIPLSGSRVALPYYGYLYPHKYPRNRFTMKSQVAYALWPEGRLGALEAAEDGSFTTLPLMFEGRKLVLNVQTRHAGYVQVEVADMKGRPLPGRSFAEADMIIGDHLNRVVTWQGEEDLKKKPDQAIMLRFRLRAAKLFAFKFGV